VVEYTDANLQTGDLSFAFSETSKTATLSPAVNTFKSWLLYTYECAPAFCNGDAANIGSKLVRGLVTDSTTLSFDRSNPGISGETVNVTWYLVEFTDATTVQHASEPFGAAEAQRDVTLTPVSGDRSLAAAGDYLRGGRSPYAADDNPGLAWFTLDLTSSTNLRLERGFTGDSADVGWFVVEFDCACCGLTTSSIGSSVTVDSPGGEDAVERRGQRRSGPFGALRQDRVQLDGEPPRRLHSIQRFQHAVERRRLATRAGRGRNARAPRGHRDPSARSAEVRLHGQYSSGPRLERLCLPAPGHRRGPHLGQHPEHPRGLRVYTPRGRPSAAAPTPKNGSI
jgi:hypothetical protein